MHSMRAPAPAGASPRRQRGFPSRSATVTPMDFDLNLAALKGADNPVYYVQYAGARIYSILKQAPPASARADVSLLQEPEERELIFLLARFPDVVVRVAEERAPQHLPRYLTELAQAFHSFYRRHRILDAGLALRDARLALIRAVLAVNVRGLSLMGISQPEEM